MRDSAGRIYMERWLLAPKGTNIKSRMSWIQIADPIAHTLTECSAFKRACEIRTWNDPQIRHYTPPPATKSGPIKGGKGFQSREDLGLTEVLGVPAHAYRDTLTLNTGAFGNDQPMSTIREYRFSPDLDFNLTSTLNTPPVGRQVFNVTEITRTEPEPKFFTPPAGWPIIDLRNLERDAR